MDRQLIAVPAPDLDVQLRRRCVVALHRSDVVAARRDGERATLAGRDGGRPEPIGPPLGDPAGADIEVLDGLRRGVLEQDPADADPEALIAAAAGGERECKREEREREWARERARDANLQGRDRGPVEQRRCVGRGPDERDFK